MSVECVHSRLVISGPSLSAGDGKRRWAAMRCPTHGLSCIQSRGFLDAKMPPTARLFPGSQLRTSLNKATPVADTFNRFVAPFFLLSNRLSPHVQLGFPRKSSI